MPRDFIVQRDIRWCRLCCDIPTGPWALSVGERLKLKRSKSPLKLKPAHPIGRVFCCRSTKCIESASLILQHGCMYPGEVAGLWPAGTTGVMNCGCRDSRHSERIVFCSPFCLKQRGRSLELHHGSLGKACSNQGALRVLLKKTQPVRRIV